MIDLSGCRIVLVRPHYAGNIGSVARVMKNFGLTELICVDPVAQVDSIESRRLATHGIPIIAAARIVATLDEAVADCCYVVATAGKVEGLFRKHHYGRPDELMPDILDALPRGKAALVFGPEPDGLSNEEIARCHGVIRILTAPEYTSLNLAQSAAVCLHELHMAKLRKQDAAVVPTRRVASFEDQERMFNHLKESLERIHFLFGDRSGPLMHALRQLVARSKPSPFEVKILHGLARQILWFAENGKVGEKP